MSSKNVRSSTLSGSIPPVLALIIGINEYASTEFRNLNAAVADADLFEELLKNRLNVPDAHIINLRNKQATRQGIIDGFQALQSSSLAKKDEAAIIIFYAGHGGQVDKPDGWADWFTSSGQIEVLCPHDLGVLDDDGDVVVGIPDRSISALLNHISEAKGNNITLILDCCSAAGMNRGGEDSEDEKYILRSVFRPPPLKATCDQHLWSQTSRGGAVSADFSGRFHASHVLLAACGREQFARENATTKQGVFTYSLLKVLNNNDLETLTYTSLMHKMNMPTWQIAHCEGQGANGRLFNPNASGADTSLIVCQGGKEGITMSAGAAQGITPGSRLAVYPTNLIETEQHPNRLLGYLTVQSTSPLTSQLSSETTDFKIPLIFYSRLVHRAAPSLKLYSKDLSWLETVFPLQEQQQLSVEFAQDLESCQLQLSLAGGKVYFDRHDALAIPHIGGRFHHTISAGDVEAIHNVVSSFRDFYRHLFVIGPEEFGNMGLELEFTELEKQDTGDPNINDVFHPTGGNLIKGDLVTITVDELASYGMIIRNKTGLHLYPYLFWFDPEALSIAEWYTPPFSTGPRLTARNVDFPLPAQGTLTIGFGDGGVGPWEFSLPEGRTKDIGFFKLFLSNKPTSFSNILQDSPFDEDAAARGGSQEPEVGEERWATKMVTVVQVAR